MATQKTTTPSIIGTAVPRVDGRLKTSGGAMYSADYNFPEMVYLVPVCSSIARGKITRLDASDAEQMPGVLRVMYHGNLPTLYRPIPGDEDAVVDESRPPF
jgi:xanthine dehydrogenase YagR molybdenum-binding subunit